MEGSTGSEPEQQHLSHDLVSGSIIILAIDGTAILDFGRMQQYDRASRAIAFLA